MSLFSSIILPRLQKELIALEPEIARFIVGQLKSMSAELVIWAEKKLGASAESQLEDVPQ